MEWAIWAYRQVFCCKRKIYKLFYEPETQDKDLVSPSELPWLWLGVVNSVGQTIVATHIVNDKLYYDRRITSDYLSKITGFINVGVWKYIDAKTLEEKDFPSDGFIIKKCQK